MGDGRPAKSGARPITCRDPHVPHVKCLGASGTYVGDRTRSVWIKYKKYSIGRLLTNIDGCAVATLCDLFEEHAEFLAGAEEFLNPKRE